MKLLVVSDLHLEFQKDHGNSLISRFNTKTDLLVVAGDLTNCSGLEQVFLKLCSNFKDVVYVLGNHEFYGNYSYLELCTTMKKACNENPNLHWLENNTAEINDQRFIGGTMWFRDCDAAQVNSHWLNDFRSIKDFRKWVYKKNKKTVQYLENNVRNTDIVITHHMPSNQSVGKAYKNSIVNCYFVCDMEPLIIKAQPKVWIHGHGHDSMNYNIDKTKIIANPFGYAGFELNKGFSPECIIDTDKI